MPFPADWGIQTPGDVRGFNETTGELEGYPEIRIVKPFAAGWSRSAASPQVGEGDRG